MKMNYPPLSIYTIPSNTWCSVKNGLSFKIIQHKIDDCFRRLIKGTNRSQERDRLISWFEQLKIFTPLVFQKGFESELEPSQSNRDGNGNATTPGNKDHQAFGNHSGNGGQADKNTIKKISLPPQMVPEWSQLLIVMAKAQSKKLILSGAPDGIPPFLSSIWAPSKQNTNSSEVYRSTVDRHLIFLEERIKINESNHQLIKMLNIRKEIFKLADQTTLGIIEHTGDLFEKIAKDRP